jgi:hypothetical protein
LPHCDGLLQVHSVEGLQAGHTASQATSVTALAIFPSPASGFIFSFIREPRCRQTDGLGGVLMNLLMASETPLALEAGFDPGISPL